MLLFLLACGPIPNRPPNAAPDMATAPRDMAIDVVVLGNDWDPDGDHLEVSVPNPPPQVTCEVNADGSIGVTPAPGFSGEIKIPYTLSDGKGLSGTSVITLTVTPEGAGKPPDAVGDKATTIAGTIVDIDVLVNDTDPDGDRVLLRAVTVPEAGQAQISRKGTITYVPRPGWTGDDWFNYTVTDGKGNEGKATVEVKVTPK